MEFEIPELENRNQIRVKSNYCCIITEHWSRVFNKKGTLIKRNSNNSFLRIAYTNNFLNGICQMKLKFWQQ